MTLRNIFGERVHRRCMALGMNQQQLARVTGIPYPTLSRVEHGEQSLHYERVVVLADALEVSTDYLLNRTDDPAPPKRQRRRSASTESEEESKLVGTGWEKVVVGAGERG